MTVMLSPARLKYIVISLLLVFGMFNFTRTTMDIIQSSKRLESMQKTVSNLEKKKKALDKELKYKKTVTFVEEQARNRLNMAKNGEEVLVLPAALRDTSKITSRLETPAGQVMGDTDSMENEERRKFWLWLELFF